MATVDRMTVNGQELLIADAQARKTGNDYALSMAGLRRGFIGSDGNFLANDDYICTGYIPLDVACNVYVLTNSTEYPVHVLIFDTNFALSRSYTLGANLPSVGLEQQPMQGRTERYFVVWTGAATVQEFYSKIQIEWTHAPCWLNGYVDDGGVYHYNSSYIVSSFVDASINDTIVLKSDSVGIRVHYYDNALGSIEHQSFNGQQTIRVENGAAYYRIWFTGTDPRAYSQIVRLTTSAETMQKQISSVFATSQYDLTPDAQYTPGNVYRVDQQQVVTWDGYGLLRFNDIGRFASIAVSGYSESMSTFGYGIFNAGGGLLQQGGLSNGLVINVPAAASYALITINANDRDSVHYEATPVIVQKINAIDPTATDAPDIVVIGDSWSDTNPEHTTYTKWPVIFQQNVRCNMHIYAQNGSTFSGESPRYGENGNVKGQTQAAVTDGSFDHANVRLIIAMGGINDYRSGREVAEVVTAFVSRINEMKTEFANARVVVFLNNQIYLTDSLWAYLQGVKNGIKQAIGVPVFSMFGWVPANHYIPDNVHVDNVGYKIMAANVISCCYGGAPTFVTNEASYALQDGDQNIYTLAIREFVTDDGYKQAMTMNAPSGATGNQSLSIVTNADDHKLLGMMTNNCILSNIDQAQTGNMNVNSFAKTVNSTEDGFHRGLTGTISIKTGQYSGTYAGTAMPH